MLDQRSFGTVLGLLDERPQSAPVLTPQLRRELLRALEQMAELVAHMPASREDYPEAMLRMAPDSPETLTPRWRGVPCPVLRGSYLSSTDSAD